MAPDSTDKGDARSHGNPEAKWAAVIDDRLAPMPRRQLKARDILHQSGANSDVTLVRDFNSPNDVGFEAEAVVDMAGGNVFRTATSCERRHYMSPESPPKLAFVVDDRWEVTIEPQQTGESLRGLLSIHDGLILFRDFESPFDEPVYEEEGVKFEDGPVFITRKSDPKTVTIVVEGTPHEWSKRKITYAEVVTLFDPDYPQHPERTYSVRYKKGPSHKPEGILTPGASVKVKDGMSFNVSPTGQS